MTAQSKAVGEAAANNIVERNRAMLDRSGLSFQRLIRELKPIALSDIADYVIISEGGSLVCKTTQDIPKAKRSAIKKVKEHTRITESADGEKIWKDSRVEYELYDKLSAITQLLKLRGDFPAEKQESTVEVNYKHELSPELAEMVSAVIANGTASLAQKPSNGNGKKNGGKRK